MWNYPGYSTKKGQCVCGDSLSLMKKLANNSVDLFITSPPFALQRKKTYGNEDQNEYVDWLSQFASVVYKKLKEDGSFVIDIGGAYEKGQPTYSLYQFRLLIKLCDEIGFHLAQPFYWHNPSALPAPIEWVNKRKMRVKTSVNTVWWLCKTPFCKSDVTQVLVPYSERMQTLFKNPDGFMKNDNNVRPSGHVIKKSSWSKNNGGSIPSNLLQISNSESNTQYLRMCKTLGIKSHPARFPSGLPEFFIKMLTHEDDIVVDIFGGSNTTGWVAENLNRRWLTIELLKEYVASSVFRFSETDNATQKIYDAILAGRHIKLDKLK